MTNVYLKWPLFYVFCYFNYLLYYSLTFMYLCFIILCSYLYCSFRLIHLLFLFQSPSFVLFFFTYFPFNLIYFGCLFFNVSFSLFFYFIYLSSYHFRLSCSTWVGHGSNFWLYTPMCRSVVALNILQISTVTESGINEFLSSFNFFLNKTLCISNFLKKGLRICLIKKTFRLPVTLVNKALNS